MPGDSNMGLLMEMSPHILVSVGMLFLVISASLTDWSHADVSVPSQEAFGTADIGLWRACSHMTPETTQVFSVLGNCRRGHCVRTDELTQGSLWDSQSLCDRATVCAAFAFLAIFFAFGALVFTSWRSLANRTVLWWKGSVYSFSTAFFSMISWAVWIRWKQLMNDNRPEEATTVQFSSLSNGSGVILQIVACVMFFINGFLCKSRAAKQAKLSAEHKEQQANLQEQLNNDPRAAVNGVYDLELQDVSRLTNNTAI
eukprot:m.546391 g.546391  ORF g.546391 m.546391 type:complete len:256 (-) comp22154_c0_seq2:1467-2234(-)